MLILLGVGVVALGGLVYWWMRPVSWQDSEGVFDDPRNPYMDTDTGSWRWAIMRGTDEGQAAGWLLNLRDWIENERNRWRR